MRANGRYGEIAPLMAGRLIASTEPSLEHNHLSPATFAPCTTMTLSAPLTWRQASDHLTF